MEVFDSGFWPTQVFTMKDAKKKTFDRNSGIWVLNKK